MSFLGKITQSLKGQKKQATYITQLPNFQTESEMKRFFSEKERAMNAELKARVLKLEAKNESLQKQLEQDSEYEKIEQEVVRQKITKKNKDKQRALKMKFEGLEEAPTFFLKSNKKLYKLAGIYWQEHEDGRSLFYAWLKDGRRDLKFPVPVENINEMFKEQVGIVSQIKGGKVDSNFDKTEDGSYVLKSPNFVTEDNEKIRIVHLGDVEKKKYEDQIAQWQNHVSKINYELKQLKLKEIEYMGLLSQNEIHADVAEKESAVYKSMSKFLSDKQATSTGQLASSLSVVQDLEVRNILQGRLVEQLDGVVDKVMEKLGRERGLNNSELEDSKTRKIVRETASHLLFMSNRPRKKEGEEHSPEP